MILRARDVVGNGLVIRKIDLKILKNSRFLMMDTWFSFTHACKLTTRFLFAIEVDTDRQAVYSILKEALRVIPGGNPG